MIVKRINCRLVVFWLNFRQVGGVLQVGGVPLSSGQVGGAFPYSFAGWWLWLNLSD